MTGPKKGFVEGSTAQREKWALTKDRIEAFLNPLHKEPGMPPRNRLAERFESGELFRAIVDHQKLACLMVDAGARLFDSSAAGAALLETGMWLKLCGGGRLAGPSEADTTRLQALAKRTAYGRGGGSMRIRNEWGAECAIQAIPAGARGGNPA